MSPKEKAQELINLVQEALGDHPESLEIAKSVARQICEQIRFTNPTIKGTSADLVTMIVQTKAFYYQVEEQINATV